MFCVGGDIGAFAAAGDTAGAFIKVLADKLHEAVMVLTRMNKPMVALVNGPAAGAGARRGTLALGAMPVAAGVVGDPPVPAVVAGLDVTAQRGGAAGLNRRHDLELAEAQMPGMGCAIGGPGTSEDVGDLERGAHWLNRAAIPFASGLPSG